MNEPPPQTATPPDASRPNAWLLRPVLALLGCAQAYLGVRGLLSGRFAWQQINEAGSVLSETVLTGPAAYAVSSAHLLCGVCWLVGAWLAPAAVEARERRGGFFSLPGGRGRLLKSAIVVWLLCAACLAIVAWTTEPTERFT